MLRGFQEQYAMHTELDDLSVWCWDAYESIISSLCRLSDGYERGARTLQLMYTRNTDGIVNWFDGNLRLNLPSSWKHVTQLFFDEVLRISEDDMDQDTREDRACAVVRDLRIIGLYDEAVQAILVSARKVIDEKVNMCKGEYEKSHLGDCLRWTKDSLYPRSNRLLRPRTGSHTQGNHEEDWLRVLEHLTREKFCSMRISEIFPIVRDTPDEGIASEPVFLDLKECLKTPIQKNQLVATLRAGLDARVLHAGAATEDILTVFISTEKALRFIDPSSNLLMRIIQPLKQYLRTRSDTVKLVLQTMLDPDGNLADAMREPDQALEVDDDDKMDTWEPEAIDAVGTSRERNVDVVTMLIGIFEDNSVFSTEFHNILSAKLLAKIDYDVDQETRDLELLKIRFGEAAFQKCEVMLTDMAASRRMHKHVVEANQTVSKAIDKPIQDHLEVTTISHLFWPKVNTTPFKNPFSEVVSAQAAYEKVFEERRLNCKVRWRPNAGLVQLSLDMDDGRTEEVTVTELQAAVIYEFGDDRFDGTATLEQLRSALQTDNLSDTEADDFLEDLQDCVQFWTGRRMLRQIGPDRWKVIENEGEEDDGVAAGTESTSIIHDTRKTSDERALEKQQAEMRNTYQAMILAILTNQGPQPADSILRLLVMFMQFSHAASDLQWLLDSLVAEGQITAMLSGKYGIVPKGS
ncbi:Anaphase-promoting complex subunit 2 [Thoreauomyces humboldtii]|nr:Anaphase-promoting complex subunit 2 [Thoreauomyces humboldtii]